MNSFYSTKELASLGLKRYGENVLISRKCSIYGAQSIEIGDNVRIDDFCILSGHIILGSNIHISAYVALFGGVLLWRILREFLRIQQSTALWMIFLVIGLLVQYIRKR